MNKLSKAIQKLVLFTVHKLESLTSTQNIKWQVRHTSVNLYTLTQVTLMSPGKDETWVCGYIYIYIYIEREREREREIDR